MGKFTPVFLVTLGVSLLLVSCGDTSILNPAVAENHALNIKTIPEGGMLETGESLVFSVFSPAGEESPSRLDITLFAEDGNVAASKSIEDPNAGQDITLDFPDMETGRYRIEFILYGNNSVLSEKNFNSLFC